MTGCRCHHYASSSCHHLHLTSSTPFSLMQLEHDVGKKKAKGEAKAGDAGGEAEEIKGDGKGGVQAVCFNESGDWLISVLRDNVHTLTIWEWRTHTKLYQQDMMQVRNYCAPIILRNSLGAIL